MSVTTGFRAVSFYDPDDGTVVQINEAELSGESSFEKQEVEPDQLDPTGGHPYVADECVFTVESWDWGAYQQLSAWAKSNKRISAVAAGVQKNVQWYERDRISVQPVPLVAAKGQVQGFRVVMRRTAPHPRIWSQVNLLAHLGWKDADGDDLPDGWSASERVADSAFIYPDFAFQSGTGDSAYIFHEIPWPVQGGDLTFSMGVSVLSSNPSNRFLVFRDHNGDTISSVSSAAATKGRKVLAATPPPQTLSVLVQAGSTKSTTDKMQMDLPALRVGDSVDYASY